MTRERFWVLFLFGLSTMINACGWISIAPCFLLVEDVSSVWFWLIRFVLITALWCFPTDGKHDVILLHGPILANELPVRLGGREIRSQMGRHRRQLFHCCRPLGPLLYQLELPLRFTGQHYNVPLPTSSLQLTCQSHHELVPQEGTRNGNHGRHLDEYLRHSARFPPAKLLCQWLRR